MMTPKKLLFAQEYMIDQNATQAAVKAGYSVKTARTQGSKLLTDVDVNAYIRAETEKRARRLHVSADRVMEELAKIAFLNPTDLINVDDGSVKNGADTNDTAVIAGVRVKTRPTEYGDEVEKEVKLVDKTKALDLLGKRLGMWDKKLELEVTAAVQIVDDIPKGKEEVTVEDGDQDAD